MRRDRDERGERGKEKKKNLDPDTLPLGPQPAERLSLAVPCDGTGHLWWTAYRSSASGGRRWLLRSRVAGSESPVPCSSPDMADGSRLRPPGERRRLLRSLLDGSHPSSTQEHGSEPSVPPDLLSFQHHRLGQPLAVSASPCCPTSSAPRSPQQRGLLLTACPSFLPGFGTNVTKFVDREEGGGNRRTFKQV